MAFHILVKIHASGDDRVGIIPACICRKLVLQEISVSVDFRIELSRQVMSLSSQAVLLDKIGDFRTEIAGHQA